MRGDNLVASSALLYGAMVESKAEVWWHSSCIDPRLAHVGALDSNIYREFLESYEEWERQRTQILEVQREVLENSSAFPQNPNAAPNA